MNEYFSENDTNISLLIKYRIKIIKKYWKIFNIICPKITFSTTFCFIEIFMFGYAFEKLFTVLNDIAYISYKNYF